MASERLTADRVRRPPDEPSIAIIDAGTGASPGRCAALTTALACNIAGLSDVTLYTSDGDPEQTNSHSQSPGVELSPNATRILRSLNVLETVRAESREPQFIHQRSHRSGFQLSTLALGAMAEGRYNAPFLHTTLTHLDSVLTHAAHTRGVQQEQLGPSAGLSQNQTQASLHRSDLPTSAHDVILIANDPQQTLRHALGVQPLQPKHTDWRLWTGRVTANRLPAGAFGPVLTQWLGPNTQVIYHHLLANDSDDTDDSTTALQFSVISTAETLDAALAGWHPSLLDMIEVAQTLEELPVEQFSSPDTLVHGRFLFLAASAHPLLPHLPQQTALGIEDGWVLARMLDQWQDEPESALPDYERYRLPRARRLQQQASARALEDTLEGGTARWARNLKLTFGSRFLPELAMQKNDWLYGYDAVNGFE